MGPQTFSKKGYMNFIHIILAEGYRFVTLEEFDHYSTKKQVILRHDVDYSPQKALELAKIDHSLDVSSIFFFLVRGHWYNFFGHYAQKSVQEIHAMGFPIGLHYAPPPHMGDDQEKQRQQLLRDFSLMRSEFPHAYPAFSWHVPPPLALHEGQFKAPDGLADMYSERFFYKAKYVSDSSLRNSYEYLIQIFLSGENRKVQLVLHPVCWLVSRPMVSTAELVGEIVRSLISDGQFDLQEKTDYLKTFPLGLPSKVLDQITALIVNCAEKTASLQK